MIKGRDHLIMRHIETYGAISLEGISKIYFNNSYKSASRRMLQLEKLQMVNSYKNFFTGEKVFYQDKVLPVHDLLVLDLWHKLIDLDFEIKSFRVKKKLLQGDIVADAFIECLYGEWTTFIILEMDLNHFTKKKKIVDYERFYTSYEIENLCGDIKPLLLIARPTNNDIRYTSKLIDISYTDIYYSNLKQMLFG